MLCNLEFLLGLHGIHEAKESIQKSSRASHSPSVNSDCSCREPKFRSCSHGTNRSRLQRCRNNLSCVYRVRYSDWQSAGCAFHGTLMNRETCFSWWATSALDDLASSCLGRGISCDITEGREAVSIYPDSRSQIYKHDAQGDLPGQSPPRSPHPTKVDLHCATTPTCENKVMGPMLLFLVYGSLHLHLRTKKHIGNFHA